MSFSITIGEREIAFLDEDKTILNTLDRENIESHYHCRDGYCGACRCTLVKGSINYPQGEPLAFIGENEILTCCSYPTSDIVIELD